MAVYQYTATDVDASVVKGRVIADTPRQARDQLRDRGLSLREVSSVTRTTTPRWRSWTIRRSQDRHVLTFVRELSTLLSVGIPLPEAISTLARQFRGSFGTILLDMQSRIAAGSSLAQAMGERPDIFDDLCLNIVKVGENAGTLDTALSRLADFRERAALLKGRLVTALIYPAIVLMMAVAVSVFLMTYVVPKLLAGIIEAGHAVPAATRLVQSVSIGLTTYWWLILSVSGGLFLLGSAVFRTRWGQWQWSRWQLAIPILGNLIRKQAIVRICVVIATLLRSGIVLDRAIQIARHTSRNLVMQDALARVEHAIEAGQDISQALAHTRVFPDSVVQIFAVGEQSGRLEEVLDRLATDYDRHVAVAAQRFTAALEPLLIVFMVLVVGLIAFATVLPMLEASNVLQ